MWISRIFRSSGSPRQALHLVAGFGRIIDLKPEQFLTEIGDAADLLEAEQGAVEHMNEDHREAMNLYATRLLGAEPADWRCTGCDPDGMDMQAGSATLRLDFPERVTGAMALRKMLVRLAGEARAKARLTIAVTERGFERARTFARPKASPREVAKRKPAHEIPPSIDIFSVPRAVVGHLPHRAVAGAKRRCRSAQRQNQRA